MFGTYTHTHTTLPNDIYIMVIMVLEWSKHVRDKICNNTVTKLPTSAFC
jgi:hypothetical protein